MPDQALQLVGASDLLLRRVVNRWLVGRRVSGHDWDPTACMTHRVTRWHRRPFARMRGLHGEVAHRILATWIAGVLARAGRRRRLCHLHTYHTAARHIVVINLRAQHVLGRFQNLLLLDVCCTNCIQGAVRPLHCKLLLGGRRVETRIQKSFAGRDLLRRLDVVVTHVVRNRKQAALLARELKRVQLV